MVRVSKSERQVLLQEKLKMSPFVNDEELAGEFGVSVATIRLDRLELGIPELRVRIKQRAQENKKEVRATHIVGELIDCNVGMYAISIMEATAEMVDHAQIVLAQFLYAQADSLAHAVVNKPVIITSVGNIKYRQPVTVGDRLVAKAELKRVRDNKYFVWVKTRKSEKEVFRAKFILESLE